MLKFGLRCRRMRMSANHPSPAIREVDARSWKPSCGFAPLLEDFCHSGSDPIADAGKLSHAHSDEALILEEAKPSEAPFDLPDQVASQRCCGFLISYHPLF